MRLFSASLSSSWSLALPSRAGACAAAGAAARGAGAAPGGCCRTGAVCTSGAANSSRVWVGAVCRGFSCSPGGGGSWNSTLSHARSFEVSAAFNIMGTSSVAPSGTGSLVFFTRHSGCWPSAFFMPVPFMDRSRTWSRGSPEVSGNSRNSAWYCEAPRCSTTMSLPGARPMRTATSVPGLNVKLLTGLLLAPSRAIVKEMAPSSAIPAALPPQAHAACRPSLGRACARPPCPGPHSARAVPAP
mmetsp:Transcript_2138/g.5964  ORF Transcript_2138/g.5964 Transcript_2138/m.5964 type:complete len:243 (+) Transcript_2138:509-1237(+)